MPRDRLNSHRDRRMKGVLTMRSLPQADNTVTTEPSQQQLRAAIKRSNRLRHALRILVGECVPVPERLYLRLFEAGQELERLRGEEGVA